MATKRQKTAMVLGGVGVATGLILLLSRNGEEPPEPPPLGLAEFVYISELLRESRNGRDYWSVDIENIGEVAGECTVLFYTRMEMRGTWSSFQERGGGTKIVEPGEIVTFSGSYYVSPYTYQFMVKSEAGTLLNPPLPLEIIHSCGHDEPMSFATQEELDAHMAEHSPELVPMPHLDEFWLQGLTWPDHFRHQPEFNPDRHDLGKIVQWKAQALLNESDYDPDAGWSGQLPVTGEEWVPVSETLRFEMPSDWLTALTSTPCGPTPNSTILRLFYKTEGGGTGWLGDSGWLKRIPPGSLITFDVDEVGTLNWLIT